MNILNQLTQRFFHISFLFIVLSFTHVHAVLVGAGELEVDGTFSAIDYRFFDFSPSGLGLGLPDGAFNFGASRIFASAQQVENPDGIIHPDLDLIIYIDDGTFSNVVGINNGVGASAISHTDFFLDVNYVAVVGTHPLSVGESGAFHQHTNERLSVVDHINYEFVVDGGLENIFSLNCRVSGNLDGSYTAQAFGAGGNDCSASRLTGNQSVPEPATSWTILLGLLGLLSVRFRKKNASMMNHAM